MPTAAVDWLDWANHVILKYILKAPWGGGGSNNPGPWRRGERGAAAAISVARAQATGQPLARGGGGAWGACSPLLPPLPATHTNTAAHPESPGPRRLLVVFEERLHVVGVDVLFKLRDRVLDLLFHIGCLGSPEGLPRLPLGAEATGRERAHGAAGGGEGGVLAKHRNVTSYAAKGTPTPNVVTQSPSRGSTSRTAALFVRNTHSIPSLGPGNPFAGEGRTRMEYEDVPTAESAVTRHIVFHPWAAVDSLVNHFTRRGFVFGLASYNVHPEILDFAAKSKIWRKENDILV